MPITRDRFVQALRASRQIYEHAKRIQWLALENRENNKTIEEAYRIAREEGDEATVPRRAFDTLNSAYEAFCAIIAYEQPPFEAVEIIAEENKYFAKNADRLRNEAARQRRHRAIMRGPDHMDGRFGSRNTTDADAEWTDPDDADAELVALRKANPDLTREEIHALREREQQQRADDAQDAGEMFGGNGPRSEPRN